MATERLIPPLRDPDALSEDVDSFPAPTSDGSQSPLPTLSEDPMPRFKSLQVSACIECTQTSSHINIHYLRVRIAMKRHYDHDNAF